MAVRSLVAGMVEAMGEAKVGVFPFVLPDLRTGCPILFTTLNDIPDELLDDLLHVRTSEARRLAMVESFVRSDSQIS